MSNKIQDLYEIIFDKDDPKKWCVKLLEPCDPFHEIILSYGKFSIKEIDGVAKINFENDIIYVPDRLRGVDLPDEAENQIQTLLGKILIDILEKFADKTKNEDGKLFLELVKDD